jgi:hypothetical protein
MGNHYLRIMRSCGIFYFAFCALFTLSVNELIAQNLSLTKVTSLEQEVAETSGLLNVNGRIFTHNDSGNKAELYELDTISGAVKRKIALTNASNNDWEDLSSDDHYIYIGDFGNNRGDRKNLRIYRVSREQLLSSENIQADTINFIYDDQKTFSPALYTTNYDAESFIVAEDHIYVFTKNWGNFKTNIYKLPSVPGKYQAIRTDSLNVNGLVTCATYNAIDNSLILVGYSLSESFLCTVYFEQGKAELLKRFAINNSAGIQIEGICRNEDYYYLSNETSSVLPASLFKVNLSELLTDISSIEKKKNIFYGSDNKLVFGSESDEIQVSVYDISGKLMFQGTTSPKTTNNWPAGIYAAHITDVKLNYTSIEKFFVGH